MIASAYQHSDYASSFDDGADSLYLEHCDGWLLRRQIDGTNFTDLANPYPMFSCKNLTAIDADINDLDTTSTISLVLRTDAFSEYDVSSKLPGFDQIRRFKTHQIANLDQPWRSFARRTCRRNAASAQTIFEIRRVGQPVNYAQHLWDLNQVVLKRRSAVQIMPLTQATLTAQLSLPGVSLFVARNQQGIQAIACFMEVGDYAYAHLLGASDESRSQSVIYGLYGCALDYYQERVQAIDFGGNAGLTEDNQDGVTRFKQGWCNQTRSSYLCCKILNRDLYQELCSRSGSEASSFFPAYRAAQSSC